ncbi:hypothetical protein TRFO_29349 [Tritrichomonas foetus]|uniref:Macro domain-containing protein n=1 Tax=Tritrichomonas foetus TaxID=1144522 RepID=A0A1J4JVY9_9EUKA|nr:hypothetical protein TRFO_29349 [Tritrichomonas foetus]|eukprot:OHT03305.1 hypothetical protein TRFO_29349 [Tritrichomonas foetus]
MLYIPPKNNLKGTFHGHDWFQHHFGFQESVESVYSNLKVEDFDDHSEIVSSVNGRRINCGKFEIKHISSFPNFEKRGNGSLNIIHGYGRYSSKIELVDVLRQENCSFFDGATFLAASNFNCLEFPHAGCNAAHGINNYGCDLTQGPTMSAAAIGACVYRNYFVKHPKSKAYFDEEIRKNEKNDETNFLVGQIEGEINLLADTAIKTRHGKAILDSDELINEAYKGFDFKNEDLYSVGVHSNCEVTTNRHDAFVLKDAEPGKIVHQVFAASFSLGSYVRKHPKTYEILRCLLVSEYKATILAAWENSIRFPGREGSNKCVLCLLGSGSFSNPIDFVAETIKECTDLIESSGLEVYVVCFADDIFKKVYPVLKNSVEQTHGKIIDAK